MQITLQKIQATTHSPYEDSFDVLSAFPRTHQALVELMTLPHMKAADKCYDYLNSEDNLVLLAMNICL